MTPSKYQQAIYNEYENTSNNLAIEAAPGSGKTTTLLELLKRTPEYKSSIFLAFNKSIADELRSKVPSHSSASTLHSIGFKTLIKYTHKQYKVSAIKNWILGKKILNIKAKNPKQESLTLFTISALVDLYRMNMCTCFSDLEKVSIKYNITVVNGELKQAMQLMEYLDKYNSQDHGNQQMMIDFVDMIYLPLKMIPEDQFPKYSVVLIDEVQDLSQFQYAFVSKLLTKRSRLISCGDPKQAIYSFMGADSDVFDTIKNRPNTTVLPLSFSYRCPKKIVERANCVFPVIESPEWQIEGEIVEDGSINDVQPGDFVLCRNNKPLIETFLYLLKQKVPCKIMGKDYGSELLKVLLKIEDFSTESKNKILEDKATFLKEKGVHNYQMHNSYVSLIEKISILDELHSAFESIYDMTQVIESMFSDEQNTEYVILSTIHKAKGGERDNVFFLFPSLIPSQYAKTQLEQFQERCLLYVCITRAKKKLIYVNSLPTSIKKTSEDSIQDF